MATNKITKEILAQIPEGMISDINFEAANIVLYTKDKEFFIDNKGLIKDIVNNIKKRVELRPDPSIAMDMEKAKKIIEKIIPEEAGLQQINFEPQRSIAVIEAEKPGLAIGKQGSILKEIREKTFWIPVVKRTPPIKSDLMNNIKSVLYENSDERRKFLHKCGRRIYDGWLRGKTHEWVRVTYLGGGKQVGRSCILLQTPESRILLDCGIDVASDENHAYPHLEAPEFKIDELDAVVVSHSHLDHTGFLPYLYKFGYKGPVYCTPPTRDIMALMQLDMIKIMKNEGKEPLYSVDDVKEMVKRTITLEYEEVSDITPDIRITFHNAGHIIGSAMVHIHIGNGLHNIVYTGDLKFGKTSLLEPALNKFQRLETLMIESTYGGNNNTPSRKECEDGLIDVITKTVQRKGRVLIPVLGTGRAQEVMVIVEELIRAGKLEKIPVYIDGMVWDITAIHSAYPEYLNRQIRKQIFHKNENPFLSDVFKRVGSSKERKEIIDKGEPCIFLATSGMLVGGPSVEYLKHICEDKRNTLVFVSYQGVGSLGRRIQNGEKEIAFASGSKQDVYTINMEVVTFHGFTGHASRKELMSFIHKCSPKPKKIIINHGDQNQCIDFANSIKKVNKIDAVVPRNLESVRLK